MKRRGLRPLAWAALEDLFDQSTGFGRLALVHVAMSAGDTLVAVSLAGSLFFSVSPHEAKTKVLAYLALTIAPFAVVSPVLGPLIDRSVHGRRLLVALAASVRVALAVLMMSTLSSWWLFPEAFAMLVFSKLYVVTRGTLVPEMARSDQLRAHAPDVNDAGWPRQAERPETGFAGFNAQLTLLGTVAGLVMGSLGAALLKTLGAPSVLLVAAIVFAVATVASLRLPRPARVPGERSSRLTEEERDLAALNPHGDDSVAWGLLAIGALRFLVGFNAFMLLFGLRREHASLSWYGAAIAVSGVGSLLGLAVVTRVRDRLRETTLIASALLVLGIAAAGVSVVPRLGGQLALGVVVALGAAVAQPSFDALTQRFVPLGAQGQTFARFAVRQQLAWVLGALLPVALPLHFGVGDVVVATTSIGVGVGYLVGRPRRPT